ncbi:MAG: hypothetical protein HN793_06595 [Rhodospirillaceae bacterium]|jgi:hypothetical protein|nr:hypothetical protein [Rhodospirillaceae bacterium]MBT5239006.1 hypothetical protein [Rhodospirillaceae bacterium]MBT5565325.1 hypothetical protein [Rhodospirillaceae bacterium]MBT6089152.1 hypothetical protein [Rhodospirillaceae bacterium]MBT7450477.1 hypothetical protein [Rhodospirillaceae bacterium]
MKVSIAIPESVRALASQARENLEREVGENDRLKWLLGLGAAFLYLALVLYISGQSDSAKQDLYISQSRLSQIGAQAKETRWPERSATAQALIKDLEERFWLGDTPGLAEAGFERWIRQTFEQHGVQVRQVQLTRNPVLEDEVDIENLAISSLQRIRAKVISPLSEEALIRFLNDAATHESWIIVEQLIVRPGRNPRLEMDLATFFRPRES